MRYALAIFDGEERYVTREEALDGGCCNLCGDLLINHPRDRRGKIAIDRHHEINIAFADVYRSITGWDFPLDESNLFWVGRGCHLECHHLLDPTYHEVGVALKEARLATYFTEQERKRHERRLTRLCSKFLAVMEPLEYGKGFRTSPAPLPQQ